MCYKNAFKNSTFSVRSTIAMLMLFFMTAPAYATTLAFEMDRTKSGGVRAPLDVLGEEDCTAATSRGCDYSADDDRVRINDIVEVTFKYAVNDGSADNVAVESELPIGLRWKLLPAYCKTGSFISGTGKTDDPSKLKCIRGNIEEGTAEELRFHIRVLGSNLDGATFTVNSKLTADNEDAINSAPTNLVATGKPRYNLRLRYYTWNRYQKHSGVNNDYGVTVYFAVETLIPSPNSKGAVGTEDLNGDDIDYTIDLADDWPAGTRLYPTNCGPSTLGSRPYSKLTSPSREDRSVIDSGTWTCSQDGGPNTPIKLTIKGMDTSGSTTPTLAYNGRTLPADDKYVGVGLVRVWVPNTELNATYIPVTATIRKFEATAKSGGPVEETKLDDNTATARINNPPPCSGEGRCFGYRKYIHYGNHESYPTSNFSSVPNYTNYNDGSITVGPSQKTRTRLYFYSSNSEGIKNVQMCDVIDRTVQNFAPYDTNPDHAAYLYFHYGNFDAGEHKIEYAAEDFSGGALEGDWADQRNAKCDDASGPWFEDIRQVPGGAAMANKVRVTIPQLNPGAAPHFRNYVSLMVRTQAKGSGVPTSTPLADFSGVRADGYNGNNWRHDLDYNPADHTKYSYIADRVLYTNAVVRISLQTEPNNQTDAVVSGEDVQYKITPKATPPAASELTGTLDEVLVTSTLAKGLSYQPGSSYVDGKLFEPEVTVNADGTSTLVWTFKDVPLTEPMKPIYMKADVAFNVLDGTKLNHTTTIYSEGDPTPERYRTRSRDVVASSPEGLRIFKKAHKPFINPNEKVIYTIAYANLSTTLDFTTIDVIDVLPFKGDERKPPTAYDGTFELESAMSESTMVTFYYTTHDPKVIDLDPNHAMHQAGGAVKWCTMAQFNTAGCPAALKDVTGVRLKDTEVLKVGSDARYGTITFKTVGNKYHSTYTNRIGGRAKEISNVVRSPHVTEQVITGALGGRVFEDNNADGTHQPDSNEGGAPGVTVKLLNEDGTVAKDEDGKDLITTTDANGHYVFTKVSFGKYKVVIDDGQGALTGYRVSPVNVGNPNSDTRYDNNAVQTTGTGSSTGLVELEPGAEPINEDYADFDTFSIRDQDSNMSIDLGYIPPPKVGIAKAATQATSNNDGSFTSKITFTLKNLGAVAAEKVQVTDNIRAQFPAEVTFTIANLKNPTNGIGAKLNTNFNGNSVATLINGDYTMPVGKTETITFDLKFTPSTKLGPFNNQAKMTAVSGAVTVEDLSDNGTNPDADNDKRANEDGENDPTPVDYKFTAAIGLAKAATAATSNNDGTFTAKYTLKVQNLGDVPINNVQVEDNIRSQFPGAIDFTIANLAATGTLAASVNTSFDGNLGNDGSQPSDILMLDGTATLAPVKTETITFDLTFTPNGLKGPFNNSAKATGSVVGGGKVEDISDNGAVTDANGNKNANENGENDPTPVNYTPKEVVGLAKSASAITANGDGSFSTTITFIVENLGDVPMKNVNITDDLSATFGTGVDYKTETLRNTSGNLNGQLNLAFEADTRDAGTAPSTWVVLKDATLAVKAKETITFKLTFWPHHKAGPFNNSAKVVGTGPIKTVEDISDNGTNTDPNGNKNPSENGENDPTPLDYKTVEKAAIGIAKSASKSTANDDGSFSTTIRLIVKNIGNVDVHDAMVTDDLRSVFPTGATYTVSNVRAANTDLTASLNTAYNGNTNRALLKNPGIKLAVGESQDIRFDIKFVPNGAVPPFYNQAVADAKSPNNVAVTDKSDNGTLIDGNNNGNAGDTSGTCPSDDDISACEDDPTPITFDGTPIIGLAKSATEATTNRDGTFTSTITLVVENLGNVPLNTLRVEDPIKNNLPDGVDFSVSELTSVGGNLTAVLNANFNGDSDVNLLTGNYQLKYKQKETLTFKLTITPNGKPSPFQNRAIAKGVGPGDKDVSDVSDNGTKTDPDGDGDPTEGSGLCPSDEDTSNCENDPTPIPYKSNDVVGLSKSAGRLTAEDQLGWFSTTMLITAENLGDAPLTDVMISDDVRAQYPAAVNFEISELVNVSQVHTAKLNPKFDGDTSNAGSSITDKNLLAETISLAVGEKQAFRFKIRFQPGYEVAPFNNQAKVTAKGPTSATEDLSDNGNEADANGNGNPREAGEDDPTPVDYKRSEAPEIRIWKGMTEAASNGDGSFTSLVTLKVKNTGNINLKNVRVTDDIRTQFPAIVKFEVSDLQSVSGNWATSLDAEFDGKEKVNLLKLNSAKLPVGLMERLTFKLRIWPATEKGPFNNQARATGQSPNDVEVTNLSENGVPGPTDRVPPTPNPNPTPVPYTASPAVGIAKQATKATSNYDSTFTSTFTLVVENLGDVDLVKLQVEDDIRQHFPNDVTFTVDKLRSVSGNLTDHLDTEFDGNTKTNLLDGTFVLKVGESEALTFDVTFNPKGLKGPFFNSATVKATGVDTEVTDVSDHNDKPDPDGDGDATETNANCPSADLSANCENDPTPVNYESNQRIGVAKRAGEVASNGDGSFTVPMFVVVENLGDVPLTEVMVSDNIRGQYPADVAFTIDKLTSTDNVLTAWLNTAFDGDQTNAGSNATDINLLTAGAKLAYDQKAELRFEITFWPKLVNGPFTNQIKANGNGPHGYTEDLSDNGAEPDANGNKNPDEDGENDPTPVDYKDVAKPVIGAAKRVGPVTANGDGSFNVTFTMILENIGNVTLQNVAMTEALRDQLPEALLYQVQALQSVSGNLTAALSTDFNGDSQQTIIAPNAGVVLQPGDKEEISFVLKFWPNGETGPFDNQVSVAAKGPYDNVTTDLSDNGDMTDSNANGIANETVDNDPTPYDYRGVAKPAIGIAKRATKVTALGDGRFWTVITMKVENIGNVDLLNVGVEDHILSQYPEMVEFTVSDLTSVSGNLTAALQTDFDGKAQRNMLKAGVTLKPSDVEELSFKVTFTPHAEAGPFNNQAKATGTGPMGAVDDLSDNGDVTDANDNGNAGEAGEDDPTPVDYLGDAATQSLGIAKSANKATTNDDGSFTSVIVLTIENLGNTEVRAIQVSDDIRDRFPAEVTFAVDSLTSVSGNMNNFLNTNFDGENDVNLTDDRFVMVPGQTEQLRFNLTITPNGKLGPFENQAMVVGKGPSKDLTDKSDNGADPDPNDNGDPTDNRGTCPSDDVNDECEDDPTPIEYTVNATPAMGVAKAAGETKSNGDGSFTTPFTVTVTNLGDVQLDNVILQDDIRTQLPTAITYSIDKLMSVSGDLTNKLNTGFDGENDQALLGADVTLKVKESQQVSFELTYFPNGVYGPFENSVMGKAMGAGKDVKDTSDNGTNPDTNGNRMADEAGENDPTPYDYADAANPSVGIAKASSDVTANGDGTFKTTITLTVKNLGDIVLNKLQVSDDIRMQLPDGVTFSVDNLRSVSGNLTNHLNANFDGDTTNINLLDGEYSLPFAAQEVLTFDLTFNPHGVHGPFQNQAIAEGEGPKGKVDDKSDDGTDPDANKNGKGNDPDEGDPTPVDYHDAATPVIGIAKMAEEATSNRDGTFSTTVTLVIENIGDVVLHKLQVTDDIRAQFPTVVDIAISDLRSVSGELTNHLNTAFDGGLTAGNDELLDAQYSMKVGQTEQLTFVLTFTPNSEGGPFSNSASTEGTGPKGPVTDVSDAGAKPDPDNDGNPNETNPACATNPDAANCENDPTPIVYTGNPAISILKQASHAESNGDGSFTNMITLNVRNMGDVKLMNVKVMDDVRAAFPTDVRFTIAALNSVSGNYTNVLNTAFNGDGDIALLGGGASLDVGKDETLTFKVTFWPETHRGPFKNQAKTMAVGPGAKEVDDLSDSGSVHDPDGDGNANETGRGCDQDGDAANCENDPTPMTYTPSPAVSAAKDGKVEGTGPYTVTFDFIIKNIGDVLLTDMVATDDLVATFGETGVKYKVLSLTYVDGPDTVAVNPEFDGNPDADAGGDINVLLAGAKLYPNEMATVRLVLSVHVVGKYDNQLLTSGYGPGKQEVSDKSDFGVVTATSAQRKMREGARGTPPDCRRNPNHVDCEDDPTPVALRVPDSGEAFVCSDRSFLLAVKGDVSEFNELVRTTNPMTLNKLASQSTFKFDALGFRFVDGYLYALEQPLTEMWRVDADGGFVYLGAIDGLPSVNEGYQAADISVDGFYWVYGSAAETLYKVDVTSEPPQVVDTVTVNGLGNIADIAFQPRTGDLYTYNSDRNELIKIDTGAGSFEVVGSPENGIGEVGALWFDGFGSLYGFEQGTNSHVTFNLADGSASLVVINATTLTPVDGASCPYTPGVMKIADPEEVEVGMVGSYKFLVSNPHPTDTLTLDLKDVLADQRTWVDATLSDTLGGTENAYGGTDTLEITGMTLAPNALNVISVDMKLPFDFEQIGQTLLNQATLSGIPEELGGPTRPSDYPFTPHGPDATPVLVKANSGCAIDSYVYGDVNHNATRDDTEVAAGDNICVNVIDDTNTIVQSVMADAVTGQYSTERLDFGDYTIRVGTLVGTGDTATCDTDNPPADFLFTQPESGEWPIRVDNRCMGDGGVIRDPEFGLFKGIHIKGTVFVDNGDNGATANNGQQETGEPGINRHVVSAGSTGSAIAATVTATCPAGPCGSVETDDGGNYEFWIGEDQLQDGGTVVITETDPNLYTSTGGHVGNSGGVHDTAAGTTTFNGEYGTRYTDIDFGDVPPNTFNNDALANVVCGAPALHGHVYTASSAGKVSFDAQVLGVVPTQDQTAFTTTFWWDGDCNGEMDADPFDITSQAIMMDVDDNTDPVEQVCIIAQVNTPNCVPTGTEVKTGITATFDYDNSDLETMLDLTDTTRVTGKTGEGRQLTLRKSVKNLTTGDDTKAAPCDVLEYRVNYINPTSVGVPGLVIRDDTPGYTLLTGEPQCPTAMAAADCEASITEGALGGAASVAWTFNREIYSGETGYVSYQVQLESASGAACP